MTSSLADFKVLPISYPSSTHILYARAHDTSKIKKRGLLADGRTLFLVNIPPDATERELILFFKPCGTVERIIFDSDSHERETDFIESESENENENENEKQVVEDVEEQQQPRKKRKISRGEKKNQKPAVTPLPTRPLRTLRKTGRSAHVVFLDSSAVDRVLGLPPEPRQWPTSDEPSGLAHYMALYDTLRPPLDTIREHADTSIELYDYELAKRKQKSKYRKGEAIVDEDGFTLVTRGGAYGQTLGGGVRVASKRFHQSGKAQRNRTKKKEPREKGGFYAFQRAERQRKGKYYKYLTLTELLKLKCSLPEILELKKNWESDKAKVEKLKKSRVFRPY